MALAPPITGVRLVLRPAPGSRQDVTATATAAIAAVGVEVSPADAWRCRIGDSLTDADDADESSVAFGDPCGVAAVCVMVGAPAPPRPASSTNPA